LTNLQCENAQILAEPEDSQDKTAPRALGLSTRIEADLTTGIDSIDKMLVLKKGQMVALHGEPSHALSLLLCVRAILPAPRGLGSSVVFIDAGNICDSYSISQHVINLGLELSNVSKKIHLSRAFTHHQVHNLITDKLAPSLNEYNASVAVVSDITALFCDPDVRDKRESLDTFRESVRFLAKTASNMNRIVIVTDLKTRDKKMKDALDQTAHISCGLEDMKPFTQVTVTRHPSSKKEGEAIDLDLVRLTGYLH
jgi:Rad51